METIRELRKQQEEDRKQFQDQLKRANRRSTMYVPNTPQKVSERTSMGGVGSLTAAADDEYEELLEESTLRIHNKTTTMKVKEPPVFDGQPNSDVKRWLELMEDFMSCFSESEVMKVQKVMLYLGEGPRIYVKTAEQEAKSEQRSFLWEDVKKILLECFLPTITEEIARARLATLKQTGSVAEYTLEFQKLDRYIPNSSAADRIDRYKRGLKEVIQRLWVQQTTLQSAVTASVSNGTPPIRLISKLSEAIAYAAQLEGSLEQYRELTKAAYRNQPSAVAYRPFNGPYYQNDQRRKPVGVNQVVITDGEIGYADGMDLEGGWDGQQPGGVGGLNQVNLAPPTFRRPRPAKPQGMSEEKYERLMKEKKCLGCEQAGHRRMDCPKLQASGGNSGSGGSTPTGANSKAPKNQDAPRH
jgi:hypothetical protein